MAMIGDFPRDFSQPVAVVASFSNILIQSKRECHDWRLPLNFSPAIRGLSRVLARSRSKKSVIAMIGGFPNLTSANQTTRMIGKKVMEL